MSEITTTRQDDRFGQRFLQDIVEWVSKNFIPGQVFSENELDDWATDNGYVKEES